jgi:hypothetical protein
MTSPGLTSPREPWFNYPKWSLIQNPPAEAPNPQIQAETDGGNSQGRPTILDFTLGYKLMIKRISHCHRRRRRRR